MATWKRTFFQFDTGILKPKNDWRNNIIGTVNEAANFLLESDLNVHLMEFDLRPFNFELDTTRVNYVTMSVPESNGAMTLMAATRTGEVKGVALDVFAATEPFFINRAIDARILGSRASKLMIHRRATSRETGCAT